MLLSLPGTRVWMERLQNQAHYNGLEGNIVPAQVAMDSH